MSQTSPIPNQRLVTELKVSAHLMMLDPGLFCIFHSPGTPAPDPASGLPGVRITRPPATSDDALSISTFNPDGWLGGEGNAALVRVPTAPAQVLVTIYQAVNSAQEAPKLQVLRLSEAQAPRQASPQITPQVAQPAPEQAAVPPVATPAVATPGERLEVAAHVQRRGDLLTRLGEWMGERGSQSWIEGFAISPNRLVDPADIEYQAVLGKGWLSPWAEGGSYCGSRGMALPILGLRVRLKGDASDRFDVQVSATFTDGTSIGPVDGSVTAEAPSLAPLEAFLVEIMPLEGGVAAAAARPDSPAAVARLKPTVAPPVAAKAAAPKPGPVKPVIKPGLKTPPARAGVSRPGMRGAPVGKSGAKGRR